MNWPAHLGIKRCIESSSGCHTNTTLFGMSWFDVPLSMCTLRRSCGPCPVFRHSGRTEAGVPSQLHGTTPQFPLIITLWYWLGVVL